MKGLTFKDPCVTIIRQQILNIRPFLIRLTSSKHAILNLLGLFPFWFVIPELILLKIKYSRQYHQISNEKTALRKAELVKCEANAL